MARPIGERIKQVLAIVDFLEEATAVQIHSYLSGVSGQSVDKYCGRAVKLGLLTVTRRGRFCKYFPADGWRDVVKDLDSTSIVSQLVVVSAKQTQPNSVFALGRN